LPDDLDAFVPIPRLPNSQRIRKSEEAEFYIAKYPVTCAQYQRFIDAGGYETERYWRDQSGVDENGREQSIGDEAWKWLQARGGAERRPCEWLQARGGAERRPYEWDNPRFHRAGYPVVGVTWYEAAAYCAWLAERFQVSGFQVAQKGQPETLKPETLKPETLTVRLPTEAEWVRAAGGEENGRYAWDPSVIASAAKQSPSRAEIASQKTLAMTPEQRKEIVLARANVKESEIGGTTPVAMYPDGASKPFGVWDMGGNVWEWTSSLIQEKGYRGAWQRGGSWYSEATNLRVSSRRGWGRGTAYRDFGFRVFAR
jgi:formylglycine-generating enzyme required for sulfatase activity